MFINEQHRLEFMWHWVYQYTRNEGISNNFRITNQFRVIGFVTTL